MFYSNNCTICQNKFVNPVTIPCGHVFCFKCLFKWYSISSYVNENNFKVSPCPICRRVFYDKHIKPCNINIYKNHLFQSRYLYTKNSKIPSISHVPFRTRNQTHDERWRKTMKHLHDICFTHNNNSVWQVGSKEKIVEFLETTIEIKSSDLSKFSKAILKIEKFLTNKLSQEGVNEINQLLEILD